MKKREVAAKAVVTAAALAGIATNTAIDHPTDLLEPLMEETASQEEQSTSVRQERWSLAGLRQWLLGLPAVVRILVALPLWCVGWVVLTGVSTLWAGAAAPLVQRILGWLCLALMLFVVFAVSVKAAYPALKLRRILRARNVFFLLGTTLLLALADLALPMVWEGYNSISCAVWRLGALCLLACACAMELKWQGKWAERTVRQEKTAKRTVIEEEARRLADTVCGK